MSKKYMPNNAMTDRMGYEIVQALNGVAGALGGKVGGGKNGGDNAVLVCHPVHSYPGEFTDPYEGKYVSNDKRPSAWLDVTCGEIKAALKRGQVVFASMIMQFNGEATADERDNAEADVNSLWLCEGYLLTEVRYYSNNVDTKVLKFSPVTGQVNSSNPMLFFAVIDDDYLCSLRMQDPNHPEDYGPDEPGEK